MCFRQILQQNLARRNTRLRLAIQWPHATVSGTSSLSKCLGIRFWCIGQDNQADLRGLLSVLTCSPAYVLTVQGSFHEVQAHTSVDRIPYMESLLDALFLFSTPWTKFLFGRGGGCFVTAFFPYIDNKQSTPRLFNSVVISPSALADGKYSKKFSSKLNEQGV